MTNKILPTFLLLLFFSFLSIAIYKYYFATCPEIKQIVNPKEINCKQYTYTPKKEISGWQTYKNDEDCYSFQYPNDWRVLESFEHIGPYVAVSNNEENLQGQNPKITVEIMDMQNFASFAATLSKMIDARVKNYWQGSQPAIKVNGKNEKNDNNDSNPVYFEFLIIPKESINSYVVVNYNEINGQNNEEAIASDILNSFNIADY